jgi:hypothetical protein
MRKLLIVLAAFAFVVAYTLPAMAASEWSFYGQARVLTFNTTESKEYSGLGVEDEDFTHDLSGSARTLGANVKAGDISGKFEAGGTLNLRLAHATWKFGAGALRVGQDYTPGDYFPSGMVYGDNSMVSYGASYTGRIPQVKLLLGGLQIALIRPSSTGPTLPANSAAGFEIDQTTGAITPVAAVTTGFDAVDTDTSMPKIEVAYSLKLGPASLKFFGGMNTSDTVGYRGTTETTFSIDSTLLGVGFSVPVAALYIKGNAWVSQNPANYGMVTLAPAGNAATCNAAGTGVEDAESMAYALVLGYKISDMITLEGSYGYVDGEVTVGGVKTESEKTFYCITAPITVAKNVIFTPEIGQADFGDTTVGGVKTKNGDFNYWGLRWRINF